MKEPIAYFHLNGKPGMKFNFIPERRKALNRQLRDENIRIEAERGREELVDNFRESITLNLSPAEIREKLKGGQRGRQKKP